MLNGRKRLIPTLSGLALVATVGLVPSAPAGAEPEIEDVQARVDRLYHEAEQASERYNDVRLELADLQGDLRSLRADQRRQGARLDVVREQVQESLIDQYQGQGLSAVGEVVVSDDPQAFLAQLSTMSAYNDLQSERYDSFATEAKALEIRRSATENRIAQVGELKEQLAEEKQEIDEKHSEAEALLAELEAEEREALLSRDTDRMPSSVSTSGRAGAAIGYAMAQVGDAYVYGAAGPSAFDCSGLTMMAWAQAGVALPHSSSAQYGSGPHIAASALQPGDLVFYYSPISHVGMYIGNGMIVHAANPGTGVVVSPLYSMPYVGAVRPG
ncbi:C40 family peptidase [Nocardioides ferulae]|uniref:C40 family peptidase n=1 Tax=Nocardioides ferulae TaxID=2340821 RepID=UPI000EB593D5|nr:C40 family peptidase [Nocardioides ferulae]